MDRQCWCGCLESEHTDEKRRWAYEHDEPIPCTEFTYWPEEEE